MTDKEAMVYFVCHSADGETARHKFDTWKKLCRAMDNESGISTGVQQEYQGQGKVAGGELTLGDLFEQLEESKSNAYAALSEFAKKAEERGRAEAADILLTDEVVDNDEPGC